MPTAIVGLVLVVWAQADSPSPLLALENALQDTIARAEPAVVAITRERNPTGEVTTAVRGRKPGVPPVPPPLDENDISQADYLPMPGDFGSGVVIGPKEIVTAFHVVKGAARIHVRAPGRMHFDAEVIAADPRSDLAVISPRVAPGAPAPKLTPTKLGHAEQLRKGSFLVVLGNPYHTAHDGSASASWGILANTTRRILPAGPNSLESRQAFRFQPTLLLLDTKLNLGMSGGAVVNLRGELVGITTTGGNAEGFDAQAGYAIPIDTLGRHVIETLAQGKEVEYGFLGVRLREQSPNTIDGVEPGTPAAEGDLLPGDTILAVADKPVPNGASVSLMLASVPVGEPVKLKIERNKRIIERSVMLSKYPVAGEVIATSQPVPWRGLHVDFTSVTAKNPSSDYVLMAMAKGGVGVLDVEPNSPAFLAGLRPGQVITRVAGKPVRSPAEFSRAVASLSGPVLLQTDNGPATVK